MIKKILLTFLMVFLLAGVSLADTVTIRWADIIDTSGFDTIRVYQSTDDGSTWTQVNEVDAGLITASHDIPTDAQCYKWYVAAYSTFYGTTGNRSNEAGACKEADGSISYPTLPTPQIMEVTITP
jgi:hypothetical protein